MRIGDRVETEDGPGQIVDIENQKGRTKRYGIKHDISPDWQAYRSGSGPTPTYYFESELKIEKSDRTKL